MKNTKSKAFLREKDITATLIMILIFAMIFVSAYLQISNLIKNRCLERMEEGVNTAIDEVTRKLTRDSQILNTAADIMAASDKVDNEPIRDIMGNITPLLDTMKIRIMMPDSTVIDASGTVLPNNGEIRYEQIAPLG